MAAEPAAPSLARRFAVAAAALAAAAVAVLAAASWLGIEQQQRKAARQLAQHDLQWQAARVGEVLVRIESRLAELAASPLLQTALTDSAARTGYLQPHLDSIEAIYGTPVRLTVVDFEGKPLATQRAFAPTAPEREWFLSHLGVQGTRVSLVDVDGEPRLHVSIGIVYPRSRTVEGALWASLRLADLPLDVTHRLQRAGAGASASARPAAPVVLPGALRALPLQVVREAPEPAVARDERLVPVFVSVALLLVLAAGLAARRVSRSLTRDLSALERFAGDVAAHAANGQRAPLAGPHEVASLAASINRMLDRLGTQHAALQSESQRRLSLLATCIAHLNDAVVITDAPSVERPYPAIVFANAAFEHMTGYTVAEVVGRSPSLLQGPDTDPNEVRRIQDALRRCEPVRVELLNYRKDGRRYWVEMEIVPVRDAAGTVVNFVAIERDTTGRRELEDKLREAQKMEAIGNLAGGIAHDFNNVLAAILGNVSLTEQELRQGRPVHERVRQIGRSAERARSLVQQILAYSRKRPQDRTPQELGGLVGETVAMLRATVPAGVSIVTQLPAEPVVVTGDGTSLEQVLLNLGTNAWQALQGRSGRIAYGLQIERPQGAAPCAHLWVQDDGCGMDEATKRRIFEPFFTTKPVGRGTGLGLAVVDGIVRTHGGTLAVDSEPGRGSTFHVRLPLAPVHDSLPAAPARPAAPRPLAASVLYVDDDEVLVFVATALLERWGCRVRGVGSAAEAIAAVQATPHAFDAVVSDFNMPGLSGAEVARAVHTVRPDLPVVVTSGLVSDEMLAEVSSAGVAAVVRKERLQDDLRAVLDEVLHGGKPAMSASRFGALDAL